MQSYQLCTLSQHTVMYTDYAAYPLGSCCTVGGGLGSYCTVGGGLGSYCTVGGGLWSSERLNILVFLVTRDCSKSTFETSPNSMKYVFGSLCVKSSVATHILRLEISKHNI